MSASVYLLTWPSVEVRRTSDGGVTLTLRYLGNSRLIDISQQDWDRLKAFSEPAMIPAPDRDLRRAERRAMRSGISCHGVWVLVETRYSEGIRRQTGFSCLGRVARPVLTYADALATVALGAIPECADLRTQDGALIQLQECTGRLGWRITPEYRETFERNPYPSSTD